MCWPYADVTLVDAPPPKPVKEKAEYVLVSDKLALYPGPSFPSATVMSFYYTYIPRLDPPPPPPPPKPEAVNPWVASLPSPVVAAPPAPPPPPPQVYYSSAPIPEPVKHNYWYGATKAEVDAQEAADAAAATAAAEQAHSVQLVLIPQIVAAPAPAPAPPAPKPQQFYCRELDGSYTLRTTTEIMQTLQPGHWTHAPSGYPYWVRTA